MQLGWIDFSKSERNKVLDILKKLSEPGTMDALGIAPISNRFADLFFPGISTNQTRAKYYLCVPYAFMQIEKDSRETHPKRIREELNEIEKQSCECFVEFAENHPEEKGIIGRRSSRVPSDIYWTGLRKFGIFKKDNLSITDYINIICDNNKEKETQKDQGNSKKGADENERDDNDVGKSPYTGFWNISTYTDDWKEELTLKLTAKEANFLKSQIINNCGNTMLSYILKNNLSGITELDGFEKLEDGFIKQFPPRIQDDFNLARSFSDFVYVLRVLYNIIVSKGKNKDAINEWNLIKPNLAKFSEIKIDGDDGIFKRLNIEKGYRKLHDFLVEASGYMRNSDIENLKGCIIEREKYLKGPRLAKTNNPDENAEWIGGKHLDYRFGNAKIILKDIFEGVKNHAESE